MYHDGFLVSIFHQHRLSIYVRVSLIPAPVAFNFLLFSLDRKEIAPIARPSKLFHRVFTPRCPRSSRSYEIANRASECFMDVAETRTHRVCRIKRVSRIPRISMGKTMSVICAADRCGKIPCYFELLYVSWFSSSK